MTTYKPHEVISIDGVAINYSYERQGSDLVLVLIHGFGASLESWSDICPFLTESYSVLRLDLKGFGFSAKPNDHHYSPEDHADLVARLLSKLGIRRVVLVGHSFGGAIALLTYFALKASSWEPQVVALTLIDSAGYPQQLPFFVAVYRNPLTRFLATMTPPGVRMAVVLNRIFDVKSQITRERIERYAFFMRLGGSDKSFTQTALQIVPANLSGAINHLRAIDVPTLIIWGQKDPVITVDNAGRFHHDIPGSVLEVLPATGHVPHEERPREAFEIMDRFLKHIR